MGSLVYLSAFLISFLLSSSLLGEGPGKVTNGNHMILGCCNCRKYMLVAKHLNFDHMTVGLCNSLSADTCAREWLQYQGNCYGYFETKKTWEEAEIECQSYHRGAHLASILTLTETLVVANHILAYQTKPSNVWIGLHDIRHANFLQLLLPTALQLLAGLCTGILLFCHLSYFCLQSIDGRPVRLETTLHFLPLSRPFLVLMLKLLASLFILLIIVVLCVQNGKWRWSDESTYNYKAWMLGKPNLGMKEYCVELVRPVHGANIPKDSNHQFEEIPNRDRRGFTKWNNTACHKLNAYICKHEL